MPAMAILFGLTGPIGSKSFYKYSMQFSETNQKSKHTLSTSLIITIAEVAMKG